LPTVAEPDVPEDRTRLPPLCDAPVAPCACIVRTLPLPEEVLVCVRLNPVLPVAITNVVPVPLIAIAPPAEDELYDNAETYWFVLVLLTKSLPQVTPPDGAAQCAAVDDVAVRTFPEAGVPERTIVPCNCPTVVTPRVLVTSPDNVVQVGVGVPLLIRT